MAHNDAVIAVFADRHSAEGWNVIQRLTVDFGGRQLATSMRKLGTSA